MRSITERAKPMRARVLRRSLELQRVKLEQAARSSMRTVRDEATAESEVVVDEAERCEADIQSDLDLALLAIRSEMLHEIDQALSKLDDGTYGKCMDCGGEIPERRLEALPSATRCTVCEVAREAATEREAHESARRLAGELCSIHG